MSSTPTTIPASAYGMPQQTVRPPPEGANGSIFSNAAVSSANSAALQNKTNKLGGSKRSFRGGAAVIPVPAMTVPYRETGAGANTTSANLTNSTKAQSEIYANKQYDGCVGSKDATCGQAGGRKKRGMTKSLTSLRGGWPAWGCMSGGRRRTCRKRRGKTCRKRRGK